MLKENRKKSTPNYELLAGRVQTNLRRAEEAVARLKKSSTRLPIASVSSSAGATLIAGITAARGPSLSNLILSLLLEGV